ncbi:Inositol 2-dehydrogenase [Planctomycetes bacterium CA13]|uniref:Inositol 2-dehydrogenase n=1 Tax=Novipirellula herctigrandis TaxID=2527986 RepID=A0A5C5ZCD4_9BACT|nr:Inositol 2-dehydrogenase [Planctomycetes bacterium CA13]
MKKPAPSRRRFLAQSAAIASAALIPTHLRSSIAATPESANDRPGLGLVGAGRMGHNHMRFAKGMCDVVAVCDVDTNHREKAQQNLSDGKAKAYNDYRHILEMDSVDVVYIATPDHWHAKILIEAMLAGKDVYCEKPLTLTVDEGKVIRKVQKKTGRVVQVGTMQRSYLDLFVKAVAIAGEGRLGRITRATASIGGSSGSGPIPEHAVPQWLDWNQWLGPAPKSPFRWIQDPNLKDEWQIGKTNGHQQFRWWYDYSGGKMTDWGAHHVDIACWALRAAGQSDTLVSIGGEAKLPVPYKNGYPTLRDQYNTASSFSLKAMMSDGTELLITSEGRNGVLLEGTKGRIFVSRGDLTGAPVEQLKDLPLPEDAISKTYRGMPTPFNQHPNHWANFFHCTRERMEPISDVTSHLRAIDICHLANLSARFDRPIRWDAQNEQIIGDEAANALLSREYRNEFAIEM